MPVVKIDDQVIGTGEPGPTAIRLRELYIDTARQSPHP
jgi:branched-subunit amino acid aminotransferase/4-amino-4-deoxychorismate lyase